MENASKALLMATGVLIGVMILSIAIFTFVKFSDINRNYTVAIEEQEIQKTNNQFEKYLKQELTAQEVVTIINMAREYNLENNGKIEVYIPDIGDNNYAAEGTDLISFVQNYSTKINGSSTSIQKFSCDDIDYYANGIIHKIFFEKQ